MAGWLDTAPDQDPLAGFPNDELRAALAEFAQLLQRNTTATNTKHAAVLTDMLASDRTPVELCESITPVFLKKDGEARLRKESPTQRKRLGDADEQRFLELHQLLVEALATLHDQLARQRTLATSRAWYHCGSELLSYYQRIKQEQRLLDFADLEWHACRLLNMSEHASWVQYKLDARIDHLLVDEFQDTNPTQWRLLMPLLEELGTQETRHRSVFLVGDRKQSIYSFRRANPALLGEAADWLETHLHGQRYPLNASRRSSRAIIDCVNAIFDGTPAGQLLSEFERHTTHLKAQPGEVELLPLVPYDKPAPVVPDAGQLRDPLSTPRPELDSQRFRTEGGLIVKRIQRLIETHAPVIDHDTVRPLHYGDIMILVRSRTHVDAFERALRDAGIPYIGASRGALLDNLEVRDLEALLHVLIAPYDNLALAQVLRSPLFGLDSDALLPLAALQSGTWYERLAKLAGRDGAPYATVYAMLEGWRALTGQVPVHDLLDRIFHEGDVINRYTSAFPEALVPRVQASLTRFIELALEIDNGRYPSLTHFLARLERLRRSEVDRPDEATPETSGGQRVRILTIHAAKGLESPAVFLADAAAVPRANKAWEALVEWPGSADRPTHFLLAGKRDQLDSRSLELLQQQARNARTEDANLLYVALTRARQYLFISGSEPDKPQPGNWYSLVHDAVADWDCNSDGNPHRASGEKSPMSPATIAVVHDMEVDERLQSPLQVAPAYTLIAPSRADRAFTSGDGDPDGRERGIAIHSMLDHLSRSAAGDAENIYRAVANTLAYDPANPDLRDWWQQALATVNHPALQDLFDPRQFETAYNEVPVQYLDGQHLVHGIIDRIVVHGDDIVLIDYKTHATAGSGQLDALVAGYREQMRLYSGAVARLWPGHTIRAGLLFTACAERVWLDALQCPADTQE